MVLKQHENLNKRIGKEKEKIAKKNILLSNMKELYFF